MPTLQELACKVGLFVILDRFVEENLKLVTTSDHRPKGNMQFFWNFLENMH